MKRWKIFRGVLIDLIIIFSFFRPHTCLGSDHSFRMVRRMAPPRIEKTKKFSFNFSRKFLIAMNAFIIFCGDLLNLFFAHIFFSFFLLNLDSGKPPYPPPEKNELQGGTLTSLRLVSMSMKTEASALS